MSLLGLIQSDQIAIAQILQDRRAVTRPAPAGSSGVETLPFGLHIVWQTYLSVLEDALSTLGSLINFLTP